MADGCLGFACVPWCLISKARLSSAIMANPITQMGKAGVPATFTTAPACQSPLIENPETFAPQCKPVVSQMLRVSAKASPCTKPAIRRITARSGSNVSLTKWIRTKNSDGISSLNNNERCCQMVIGKALFTVSSIAACSNSKRADPERNTIIDTVSK